MNMGRVSQNWYVIKIMFGNGTAEQIDRAAMLQNCVQEAFGSNLDNCTGSLVVHSLRGKSWHNSWTRPRSLLF
jgi:hypothetical protein